MTEKTGSPTECKILQFRPRPGPVLTTWGDLSGLTVTKSSITPELATNRWISDVFAELVEKAVVQSGYSNVPVYLLIETLIRQHGQLNIHVAKLMGDALKTLRRADEAQRYRLNAKDHPVVQGPRVPDPTS
ncbi:hypothetical protein D3C81_1689630 [compost metagenome]